MTFFGAWVINGIVWFIWWLLLLPVCLLIATPVILLASLRRNGTYGERIRRRYAGVVEFWREHAWALSP